MQISVTGKKLELTPAIRSYAEEKVGKIERMMDGIMEGHILLRVEKHRHIAEATLHAPNVDFVGKESSEDLYAAIDGLVDKLERQVRKFKTRSRGRRRKAMPFPEQGFESGMITIFDGESGGEQLATATSRVIKEKVIHLDRLMPEEAISLLEAHGDHFWVFTHAETSQMTVLFRRDDGNYGMIHPED